jgi:FAD/FMN-containing dehydrogenase
MHATDLRKTGRFQHQKRKGPLELRPAHLNDLRRCLDASGSAPLPIRPRGAGTASNDCNSTEHGTIVHTVGLDRIVAIDTQNNTVTAQAGVRLAALVDALAGRGLELVGGYELQGRTIGGAIAAPCFGACIGGQGSYFSSHVLAMKVVLADGRVLSVEPGQNTLLTAFRMSFGLLGIIYEVTMRVRPIRTFSASHRRVDFNKFAAIVDSLSNADVGFKFYLMPYRDRVYLDLRRYQTAPGNAYKMPWKIKDWGESTVLPHVFRSLNRVVPISSVKYNLIDTISEATQNIVNSRLVNSGTNAASQSGRQSGGSARGRFNSTWCFPAASFSVIVRAFREFCETTYADSGYRVDLPTVGYRLSHDQSAALSPSFDETMIALTVASTQARGWEDFVIDLAEFAERWGGIPLISHSRALRAEYAIQTYAKRLDFFRRTRRQLDADDRLLSPFLAQFCQ